MEVGEEIGYEKRYYIKNIFNNRIYTTIIMFMVKNRLVINNNSNLNGNMYSFEFLPER